ncbi:MAG: aminodeoxychorismate/anthranilate synthase component II [Acidobacteriia bacterium]|jgi:anthranilate synthase/aminodeoxychorismate synthase-like glutamine amidotransferase|nr:anthranilate/aminodeoxychorismate synthase component II [Actinomycetota bacterium]MCH2407811.1 aminodeoxychorismate/anthranilate synthase component II [Acidimicrobiales bacterium]MCH2694125.1 aminodeoxychorismate/anthranilate synthase component II [Terriglobia bacterium]|tara:strand:- start:17298 stop:17879 length:582 start_codon:yes stop_codon:yes gene_type:complete
MSFKVLVIDNYDSFVYNLVQYLGELKVEPLVKRHDAITIDEVENIAPNAILISPGPGKPKQAGISIDLIKWAAGKIPVLGICLGHQCIGEAWGGKTVHAPQVMHGKTSLISHNEKGLFKDIESPFEATRYHSLIVDPTSFPAELEITAKTDDGLIMGLKHKEFEIYGLQFHPESILTSYGHKLINNFLLNVKK